MENSSLDLSVVIIAYNEADNIRRCLLSLPKGAEVIVLDSGSNDDTVKIARELGAEVFERSFTNYADQKNAAVGFASKGWILSLDADEVVDDELRMEVINIIALGSAQTFSGYEIRRRLVFLGRIMKYGKSTDWPLRLFKKEGALFEGVIHEQIKLPQGSVGRISSGSLFHYSYRDLTDYFHRFNQYTTKVAESKVMNESRYRPAFHVFRPWFEFIYRYFFRLGFLDGYPGYTYALISSLYTFVKYAKHHELKSKESLHES